MAKKENTNMDELTTYYSNIYKNLEDNTIADPYGSYILGRVKGGQKTVFSKSQTEIRNFDMSFLDTIESVYPAILKIMRDPKKSIRYEEEVVSVEKAKKVNSQTVRHLSSHTQLIKEITKAGDVIPSKVLTTYAEEELAIYENRFLKSLVRRMEMFLERRYEIMKVSLESFETQKFTMSNEFLMSGQIVKCNLDLSIKNDLTVNIETTKEQFNRLVHVREMVQGLKGTEFMRALAKARDVLPPIMKTNIIMHNPDFKLCYGLWLYLDKVDGISNDIEVKEKTFKVSKTFENDMSAVLAVALTSFIKNREIEGVYSSRALPTVKSPKTQQAEDYQLELNLNADNNKLEDYTMNELLLSQTAEFFEASQDGMVRTGTPINESIRVVYRQMLDMLDQIYPKAFGVSDEELESKDLYEQLEFAKRKQMVINIVRQQKQMNIARMGKEEKRVEKTIEKLNEKIKKQEAEERLRIEREHAREEALRLAAIAREEAYKAHKHKIEDEALARQKEIERRERDKERAKDNLPPELKAIRAKAIQHSIMSRDHLRAIHAEEIAERERIRLEREAELAKQREEAANFKKILSEVGLTEEEYNQLEAEFGDLLNDEDFDPYNLDSFDDRPKRRKKKPVEPKPEPKEEPKAEPTPEVEAPKAEEAPQAKEEPKAAEPEVTEEPTPEVETEAHEPKEPEALNEEAPTSEPAAEEIDDFEAFANSLAEKEEETPAPEAQEEAEAQAPEAPVVEETQAPEVKEEPKQEAIPSVEDIPEDATDLSDEELAALEAEFGDALDIMENEGDLPLEPQKPTKEPKKAKTKETKKVKGEEEVPEDLLNDVEVDLPSADDIPMSMDDISDEELAALEAEYGDILDNLDANGNLPIEDEPPVDLDGPKKTLKLGKKSLDSLDDSDFNESYDDLLAGAESDVDDAKGKKKKKKK